MEPHHHHQNYNPYLMSVNPLAEGCERDQRDRFPQWTHAETQEFLAIRSELDQTFMETKRNKPLWEAISVRLQHKGISRTPEQCKSKWKNLVTRFKGSEAAEGEARGQFPFYEEMRSIFADRKGKGVQVRALEWEEAREEKEEAKPGESKKKRRVHVAKPQGLAGEVEIVLRELVRRQSEMEARWMAAAEEREAERRDSEQKWRTAMVAVEEERMAMARRWMEREEERRAREEARADRRHALVTALLTTLDRKGV